MRVILPLINLKRLIRPSAPPVASICNLSLYFMSFYGNWERYWHATVIWIKFIMHSLILHYFKMFKKEFQTNNLNKMSNKDKNRLKERLTACLRAEAVEAIANNCKDLWTKKIQGTKGILYLNGDMPILVDPTDHGDFFPTLQLLTIQPMLLPCVVMNEGVEAYILKGANLMWPGVATKWFEVFN